MKDLVRIIYKKRLLAFIIKANFKRKGIEFFTPDEFSLQLGYMNRPGRELINPHVHPPRIRQVKFTQEVLFVRRGKVRIDFYDPKKHYVESRMVKQGDIVFLAFGGHGFEFLERTELIEVKQGPFLDKLQPVRFKAVAKNRIKLKK